MISSSSTASATIPDLRGFRLSVHVTSLRGGGAERIVVRIANWMARNGAQVDLVLLQNEGPFLDDVAEAVRVVDLGAPRALVGAPRLVRYLRQERPDTLLSTLTINNVIAAWAAKVSRCGSRVVLREATTLSEAARNGRSALERYSAALARLSYPLADAIVGVSHGVTNDLRVTLPAIAEKTCVINNPSIPEELLDRAVAYTRPSTSTAPTVLTCGRLVHVKDFATLLRAFALVRREADARLVILGDGPLRTDLERQIRELGLVGHVELPGWVADSFSYMLEADVFALSSRWEGFPNVLVEALAAGCGIAATDCQHGPSEILAGNSFGSLVPVGDAPALSRAILRELHARRPVEAQRRRAREFSLERIMPRYVAVLTGSGVPGTATLHV